jgi:hypothetical protein
VHGYLRPGGTFVSFLSGRWAAYSVANRLLPDRVGAPLAARIGRREHFDRPVFPARYDQCSAGALRRLFASWSGVEIRAFYRGALYFRFSRPLMRLYLRYEDAACRRRWQNLATHYLVVATR